MLGDYDNTKGEPMSLLSDQFIKRPAPEWATDDLLGPYLKYLPTDFGIAVQGTRIGVSRECEYALAEVTRSSLQAGLLMNEI